MGLNSRAVQPEYSILLLLQTPLFFSYVFSKAFNFTYWSNETRKEKNARFIVSHAVTRQNSVLTNTLK